MSIEQSIEKNFQRTLVYVGYIKHNANEKLVLHGYRIEEGFPTKLEDQLRFSPPNAKSKQPKMFDDILSLEGKLVLAEFTMDDAVNPYTFHSIKLTALADPDTVIFYEA